MNSPGTTQLLIIAMLVSVLAASGCRMGVDVHTWEPPVAEKAVGKRVAIAPLAGPTSITQKVAAAIETNRPTDQLGIEVVSRRELEDADKVRLVSFDDGPPSDLALLPVARNANVDYLLVGEVLSGYDAERRIALKGTSDNDPSKSEQDLKIILASGRIAISWRVFDVKTGHPVWARPVGISKQQISETYPDLTALHASDADQLTHAVARETWKLLSPFIDKHHVQLASPWGTFGAKATRIGNAYAKVGRWPEAEQHWKAAVDAHPSQHAAIHNLAIAAVARQDYDEAKRLATEALSCRDSTHYQNTLVWVEARQRQHYDAFDIPDPQEGWRFAPSQSTSIDSIEIAETE